MVRHRKIQVVLLLALVLFFLLLAPKTEAQQTVIVAPDAVTMTNVSVTCGTTPTLAAAFNPKRRYILFAAPSTNTQAVYIGTSSVTTSTGVPLTAGSYATDDKAVVAWYCVVASGTEPLIVNEASR